MSTALQLERDRLIARVAEEVGPGELAGLVPGHLRLVATEDLAERPPGAWSDAVAHLVDRARHRTPGRAAVEVLAAGDRAGTPPGRSVLEVVTDDMPFLVDSVLLEVARQGRTAHLVVHPRWWVLRSDGPNPPAGTLLEARAVEDGTGAEGAPTAAWTEESWIRVELDHVDGDDDARVLVEGIRAVLDDVRSAVDDWEPMRGRLLEAAAGLPAGDVGKDLLAWVAADHFTFLGAADLTVGDDGTARPVPGTGLGIFSEQPLPGGRSRPLPEAETVTGAPGRALVLDKAIDRSTVHRSGNLDRLTVRTFDADGRVVAERRVLGLWSTRAHSESVMRIPGLRSTVAEVLRRAGVEPQEHAGKAVVDALEGYPRDELFAASVDDLLPVARSAVSGGGARRLRAFVRRDLRGRYVSVLVHLPREGYSTAVRERFAGVLRDVFAGDLVEFDARLDGSGVARVHFSVHPPAGSRLAEPDESSVEAALGRAARSWRDDLAVAAAEAWGEERGTVLVRRWGLGLPEGYKESTSAAEAVDDLEVLDRLAPGKVALRMVSTHVPSAHVAPGREVARLKVVSRGVPVSLSTVLPLLQSAGVEVVDERPHEVQGPDGPSWVYAFAMSHPADLPHADADVFVDAVRAMWDGRCDVDGFNALVLEAGLRWRQVQVLRAYGAYLRQGRFPFTRDSTVAALRSNVEVARGFAALFDARFDPDLALTGPGARQAREDEIVAALDTALAAVEGREHDRILRAHRAVLDATVRTNHFRTDQVGEEPDPVTGLEGEPRAHLALKILPRQVPGLPEPRPAFEVYVHSPRLEGVHLRFGAVARGGLRWSDRRDDFRTEVLGLVKAQMVKNTVIVPVGAKGGFVAKRLPDPKVDRDAWLAEGVACYRAFVSSLLDVTDNLVDGEVVTPPRVVRRDGDDHYLVVAADKGTATFSDVANALSADHGFWLGDAFASGGSVGYDHKGMGITARGAWVSVQRHFRERGVDVQSEEFTCVGIGDMSGDVFGNGLLCSPTARLVAAFDHRDVFIDPHPDAGPSYAERRRLFETPRTSWQDYDRSLISEGGGVFSRSAKTITVTAQMCEALGLDALSPGDEISPEELIGAVLRAPVDLLWNGGIGTYVKASSESHADVGDSANDAIRVDGRDLRVRVVGEGGNLGLTQAGRVEFARTSRLRGADTETSTPGAVNTDFIDNSAGVDTSDHEVNIKILLDAVAAESGLGAEERAEVLASMTDEVGRLVLADNYRQNLALADEAAGAADALHLHEQWMRELEERGVLDRDLEVLPSRTEVRRRREAGEGLTVPELAVLLSWTKIVLAAELESSDVTDDPYLRGDLIGYFPSALRQEHRAHMVAHPMRREIVTTQVVNTCIDQAGITAWARLAEETGAGADRFVLAHLVVGELFGTAAVREEVTELDHRVDAAVQTRMRGAVRDLQERAAQWLLVRARGAEVDTEEIVDSFGVQVQRLLTRLPDLLTGDAADAWASRRAAWVRSGVPDALAATVAALPEASVLLDVVRTATRTGADPEVVAGVHLALGERLYLHRLRSGVEALPRTGRWESSAAGALRDDLARTHAALVEAVVTSTSASVSEPGLRVDAWVGERAQAVEQVVAMLGEVLDEGSPDLARASVTVRAIRSLLEE